MAPPRNHGSVGTQRQRSRVQQRADGVKKRYQKKAPVQLNKQRIRLQIPHMGSQANAPPAAPKKKRWNSKIDRIGRVMNGNANQRQRAHEADLMEFAQNYYWRFQELSRKEREAGQSHRESERREIDCRRRDRDVDQREERFRKKLREAKGQRRDLERREEAVGLREAALEKAELKQKQLQSLLMDQRKAQRKFQKGLEEQRDMVLQLKKKRLETKDQTC